MPLSTTQPASAPQLDAARREISQLQSSLRAIEAERDEMRRRRRLHLAIVGVGLSLILHLCLLYFLAVKHRPMAPGHADAPISYEFTILPAQELTQLESTDLDDLLPEMAADDAQLPDEDPIAELDPTVPAAELDVASSGALPTLGGAGGGLGAGGGMSAGGAGTSFFGVSSSGTRFAFIVDRSGSMGKERKLDVAKRELARSVSGLADFAHFHVVFFSNGTIKPSIQDEWLVARQGTVTRFIRWLNMVDAGGGTNPRPAFQQVFELEIRPDVIFFLTDGQIPADTDQFVLDLNNRGGRAVINTIAFGDPSSQEQLKRIARQSGGVYRFVPTGAGP